MKRLQEPKNFENTLFSTASRHFAEDNVPHSLYKKDLNASITESPEYNPRTPAENRVLHRSNRVHVVRLSPSSSQVKRYNNNTFKLKWRPTRDLTWYTSIPALKYSVICGRGPYATRHMGTVSRELLGGTKRRQVKARGR